MMPMPKTKNSPTRDGGLRTVMDLTDLSGEDEHDYDDVPVAERRKTAKVKVKAPKTEKLTKTERTKKAKKAAKSPSAPPSAATDTTNSDPLSVGQFLAQRLGNRKNDWVWKKYGVHAVCGRKGCTAEVKFTIGSRGGRVVTYYSDGQSTGKRVPGCTGKSAKK